MHVDAVALRGTIAGVERTYTGPLLDKLGVKPGALVAVIGVDDPSFLSLLEERADQVDPDPAEAPLDLVFFAADEIVELARLAELRALLKPEGAIWVVSRKGKAATIRDVDVIEAAKAAGLVDNKVVSFSETHTSLRLVIPRAQRPPRAASR